MLPVSPNTKAIVLGYKLSVPALLRTQLASIVCPRETNANACSRRWKYPARSQILWLTPIPAAEPVLRLQIAPEFSGTIL